MTKASDEPTDAQDGPTGLSAESLAAWMDRAGIAPWDGAVNIAREALDRHILAGHGDQLAIRWLSRDGATRDISYGALSGMASRFAGVLAAHGIRPGDSVFALTGRVPELYAAALGTLKAGGVFTPLFSAFGPEPIRTRMEIGAARVLVTTPALYRRKIAEWRAELPDLRLVLTTGEDAPEGCVALGPAMAAASPEFETVRTDPESPALIHFTSGTTGKPKGAMLTHANFLHNLESATVLLETTPDDTLLVPGLPLFHLLAQICVMSALYGGVPSVLMDFFVPSMVLENIARYKTNTFSGVPTMFALLLNDPEIDKFNLSSLRICFCSSAPLSLSLLKRFEERTGAIITEGYGLTEATALVTSNPIDGERKPGSVGVPIRCEVRVVDDKDGDVPLGDVGEIIIHGKNVMKGYYNNPTETAEAMRNGWLHTGDMGKFDSDGYLYVVDRKKDMIITGGFNIYPAEVENVLYKHSGIAMATVIGVPDEIKGEIAKAYVVLKEGQTATEREIIDFCRERIAKYKAPRAVCFRESLPTTPTGKILKRALRDEVLAAEAEGAERR